MSEISYFGDFDVVQLGILGDGTPFATATGLATLCDVKRATILEFGEDAPSIDDKFRAGKIAVLLKQYDFQGNKLFQRLYFKGQEVNAYSEPVCMAILEYYAFEAGERCTEKAKHIARLLMRKSFRDFVYALVGYKVQQTSFSNYVFDRILHHHNVDVNPLSDGYFCLFDKMIELLQKFDLRIDYDLREQWYDCRKGDKRFLEPDISLGIAFSDLFKSDCFKVQQEYDELYQRRVLSTKVKSFWSKELIDKKWRLDRAIAERDLRIRFIKIEGVDSSLSIPEDKIQRRKYKFQPSPDSGRPKDLPPAYCYSNDYTSLFYEWLKDVFFKFIWRDYILERDPNGWMQKYNKFKSLPEQKRNTILRTSEGKMISGFEYREIWERQLPPSP